MGNPTGCLASYSKRKCLIIAATISTTRGIATLAAKAS
ncbi:hypothetical protein APHCRT_0398 [Anaplasma phagocytophilum str. CRT53-1]|uniref:Uncharacterized protein n=3 Tax=Anaplasma phagocytophilum TaxID=948 RepID=A0A0F3NK29_ANAPH|nr:hypothetical protein APHWEB_0147 [Anaplasma phagocytophilum str. Webster]KJV68052.1 hypothetical protein EPHNCH_0589 [Anaplasma phagocytophilum str. NCH-1]KJV83028.1 hypothetical protein APHHGE2_0594 [Anaplasma phagocytophilum str. HGE2]KJV84421.1 hypothetical protein APHWI1_1374 [Anaplasma phagocytophilum str. ApWI1]KJV87498.1 hypothetical protein APHCRT_0398 [Anaplasma phagocytophilum str. CRT53-1]KJV87926.1 hypothetical protein APHNYW_0324 [Anaplasma phagocytophilum str. ApNYW]KJV99380.